MSNTHVHMLVVPVRHLDEIYELKRQVSEARQQDRRDRFYRSNQLLLRAGQVAVASILLDQDEYADPAGSLWVWMDECLRGGKDSNVVDAEEFEAIRRALSTPRVDDLLQWADAHRDGYGDVDRAVLVEVFEALVEMVRSVPSGPHGLVYGYFFADDLEPPPPPPERTPRRPVSEQEKKWLAMSWDRRMNRLTVRAHMHDWSADENTEGRYILGLLPRERARMLRPAYLQAWRVMFEQGHNEGFALLGQVLQQLDHELLEKNILTRADLVHAHDWFSILAKWNKSEHRGVATPELAHELRRRLDALEQEHGGAEGLIEYVWSKEKHWRRDMVRQAYEQLCDLVGRAMERGHGFVWLLDRDW